MKYEKAEVEVISFDDSAEFMVASAGTIQALTKAISEMGGVFNPTTGVISGCKYIGGQSAKNGTLVVNINGVSFVWTSHDNSGNHWKCTAY